MEYLDLALCFQIEIGNDSRGIMTVALPEDIFKAWRIPREMLFHIATDNLKRLYSWQIIGLYELIETMIVPDLGHDDLPDYMNPPVCREKMFVATNESRTNGAVCLLDKEDEVIFLPLNPKDKTDLDALNQMVREVNETQVRPDEILGDHVYIYSSVDNEYHY